MDISLAHLSSERHYMGSSNAGRYCTDRSTRPFLGRLPTREELEQWGRMRGVWLAHYLREQDVIGWVLEFDDAKQELERIEESIANANNRKPVSELETDEPTLASEAQAAEDSSASGTEVTDAHDDELAELQQRRDAALSRKREASRQLRMLGISPKAQGAILREYQRRESIRREKYLADRSAS
jgi:hypothetical protein